MSTEYAVLLPAVEADWEALTEEQRDAVFAQHDLFSKLLGERGHEITGGAELTNSRETKQVRGPRGSITVTDGPYAESTEQLSGFYLVRTENLDDLLDLCGLLTGDGVVEVRPVPAPAT